MLWNSDLNDGIKAMRWLKNLVPTRPFPKVSHLISDPRCQTSIHPKSFSSHLNTHHHDPIPYHSLLVSLLHSHFTTFTSSTHITTGTYNCIGKPLALQILRTTLAKLTLEFDICFAPGEDGTAFREQARTQFSTTPGELYLTFTRRKKTWMRKATPFLFGIGGEEIHIHTGPVAGYWSGVVAVHIGYSMQSRLISLGQVWVVGRYLFIDLRIAVLWSMREGI